MRGEEASVRVNRAAYLPTLCTESVWDYQLIVRTYEVWLVCKFNIGVAA